MANDDRTEQPTPKRKEDARKKGQVVRSVEVNSAVIILSVIFFLKVCAPWIGMRALGFTQQILELMGRDWNSGTPGQLMSLSVIAFAELGLPIMVTAMVAALVANLMQVGLLVNTSHMMPKFERINPGEGFKRIFSRRSLTELLKSVAKVGVAAYIAYGVVRNQLDLFPRLMQMAIPEATGAVANLASTIILRLALFLLVLAVVDYIIQYTEFQKSIRMTKQEVKEELRQSEGDPQLKGKIRQRQRQMAMQRMMQQVPKADVVITNPTHYAVALRYQLDCDKAPVVLAKGVDEIALRIKEIAQDHDIVLYENRLLAQTLYKTVEIGQVIPEHLYEAVANVLSFVYRLRPHYLKQRGNS